jgi:methylmalonyl-CoA mutase N-terminal domain/subunit
MNVPCYDEAVAIPTLEATRVSIAIHHIVAEETGIVDTVDPLAGSYFVEALTHQMEDQAWE